MYEILNMSIVSDTGTVSMLLYSYIYSDIDFQGIPMLNPFKGVGLGYGR